MPTIGTATLGTVTRRRTQILINDDAAIDENLEAVEDFPALQHASLSLSIYSEKDD